MILSKKYNEIMDQVRVTDEMKQRVLQNVKEGIETEKIPESGKIIHSRFLSYGRTCQSGGYGQCGGGNSSQRTGQKFLHDDSSKRQKSFVILIILAWFSGFVTCFDEKNRCIPGKKEPFCPLFKSVGNSV